MTDLNEMMSPVRCAFCRGIYDLAAVIVTGRYVDCSVWRTPCCDVTADDRGETGWESRRDYYPIDRSQPAADWWMQR